MPRDSIPSESDLRRAIRMREERWGRDYIYSIAKELADISNPPSRIADGVGIFLLIWNQAFYRYSSFHINTLQKCIEDNIGTIRQYHDKNLTELSVVDDENNIIHLFNEFYEALRRNELKFNIKNQKYYTKTHLEHLLRTFGVQFQNSNDLKTIYDSVEDNPRIGNAIEFDGAKRIVIKIHRLEDTEREILESLTCHGFKYVARSPVSVAKALHILAPDFFPLWDGKIANKIFKIDYSENPAEEYFSFCDRVKSVVGEVANYDLEDEYDKPILKLLDEYYFAKAQKWI